MKKLGLIGGIGPESTISYYHDIVYGVQRSLGSSFFPNLCIESLNVFEILRLCDIKDYDGLADYVSSGIRNLEAAGAQVVALTGNTPHIVFPELRRRASVPLVSIVETACDYAEDMCFRKIGLLGTGVTMTGDFFKKPFIEKGIAVVTPKDAEIDYLAEKISSELELGVVKAETQEGLLRIVRRMHDEDGIDAVALGCTELPLLVRGISLPLPCLDTMGIHVRRLVREILE